MKLSEIISKDLILDNLQGTTKEEVIKEMVSFMIKKGVLKRNRKKKYIEAILEREALGTTGIGNGIAIPHARLSFQDKIVNMVGRSKKGIDFKAIDGEPVFIFFLIFSPSNNDEVHIEVMSTISRVVKNKQFCNFLKQAKDEEDLYYTLLEADEESF